MPIPKSEVAQSFRSHHCNTSSDKFKVLSGSLYVCDCLGQRVAATCRIGADSDSGSLIAAACGRSIHALHLNDGGTADKTDQRLHAASR
eukprot:SAG31_NODE_17069_length_684_cov_1.502564_1_plen_88_part_10